ncbi:MAG: NAD(P)-dependent oxidoreductase [Bacteroidota bacterium]
MDNICIMGGTGMLGAATARAFASAGTSVVVTSLFENDEVGKAMEVESPLITLEQVDLADGTEVKTLFDRYQFDGIVMTVQTHQYARTRDQNNQIYPILLNCLETARKHGVQRVVYGSSVAVYGGLPPPYTEQLAFPPEVPDTEDDSGLLLKFEVAIKRITEMMVLDYGQDFQMGSSVPLGTVKPEPHELEVVVLRAPMMFGPGYKALGSPLGVAAHVVAGKLPRFAGHAGYGGVAVEKFWSGLASIPINYVKDNAECIRVAMNAPKLKHHIYNISSGFTRSPREQLQAILNVAPESADRFGIKPEELPEAQLDLGFDGSLFEHDFGWKSSYTLETAFMDYLTWLQDHPY